MSSIRLRIGLLAAATMAGVAALGGFVPPAHADVMAIVNTTTGDIKLVGQPGDTLSSYVLAPASTTEYSFITSNPALPNNTWNNDRFGGTPVGAPSMTIGTSTFQVATSMADGNGTWHSMGTNTSITLGNGQQVTNQLGEMCAVWGVADGVGDIRTPVIYNFSTESTTIDLGDHYIPGSPQDLLFAYGTYPGLMNTQLFSVNGTTVSFNPAVQTSDFTSPSYAQTAYYGQTYSGAGVVGAVEYVVPEPASLALLSLGGVVFLRRKRK